MAYKINFERYSENFSLPAEIVGDEISTVNGDYLKVILLIFKNSDKNYSANLLSNLLNLPEKQINEAISYWISKGILIEQASGRISPEVIVMSKRTPQPAFPPKEAINNELAFLLECMENQLKRPITSMEYKSIVHIMETIRLPADVILMAVEYCISIDKANIRYIEKVCATWADHGITTHELAEQYLTLQKQARQEETKIKKLFGIQDRNLIESEKEHIHRWLHQFEYDISMIKLAYEKTVNAIGKLSFPYINKILSSWKEKGYAAPDEVLANENSGRKKTSFLSSSLDIDEIDRLWDNVPKLK